MCKPLTANSFGLCNSAGGAGGTDETGTNKDAHQLPVKQWGTLHCVPASVSASAFASGEGPSREPHKNVTYS